MRIQNLHRHKLFIGDNDEVIEPGMAGDCADEVGARFIELGLAREIASEQKTDKRSAKNKAEAETGGQ